MEKIFGANWKTTLWGSMAALAGGIASFPATVEFLPDSIEGYVRGIAGLIAMASGVKFAAEAKSKDVTGGTVQQTAGGCVAAPTAQKTSAAVSDTKAAKPEQD